MYGFIQKLWNNAIDFIFGFWDLLKEYFFCCYLLFLRFVSEDF